MHYIEEIKKEINYIVPYQENGDTFEFSGQKLFDKKEYIKASIKFKELICVQPEHHSGYEGFAFVLYEINEKEKAIWFMKRALDIAKGFIKEDAISMIIIDEMEENLQAMKLNKRINILW